MSMVPGLDGEIHERTEIAHSIFLFGGMAAAVAGYQEGPLAFLAVGTIAVLVGTWYTPDAETVTSDWIDYQREQQSEGSP